MGYLLWVQSGDRPTYRLKELERQGYPRMLKNKLCPCKFQILGKELWNILFAFMGFSLVLASLFWDTTLYPFLRMLVLNPGHCILKLTFWLYRGSQVRVCLKSQKIPWICRSCYNCQTMEPFVIELNECILHYEIIKILKSWEPWNICYGLNLKCPFQSHVFDHWFSVLLV